LIAHWTWRNRRGEREEGDEGGREKRVYVQTKNIPTILFLIKETDERASRVFSGNGEGCGVLFG